MKIEGERRHYTRLKGPAFFAGSIITSITAACSFGEKEAEITPESSPTQTSVASSIYSPPTIKLEGVFSPYAKDGFAENEIRLLNFIFEVWQSDSIPEFLKPHDEEQRWLVAKFPAGITDSDVAYLKFLYGLEKPSQIKPERLQTAIWGYFFPQDAVSRMKFLESGLLNYLPPEAHETIPLYTKEVLDYYSQWISADGIMIEASAQVDPAALEKAKETANRMLAYRPDIRERMIKNGARVAIIGKNEKLTDLPEHRNKVDLEISQGRPYSSLRGVSGIVDDPVAAVGEENLLRSPGDSFTEEDILHHELAHSIMNLGMSDQEKEEIVALYEDAKAAGLWSGTPAQISELEYWAEISQSYFGVNKGRVITGIGNEINGPKELKLYDPAAYEFCQKIYGPPRQE